MTCSRIILQKKLNWCNSSVLASWFTSLYNVHWMTWTTILFLIKWHIYKSCLIVTPSGDLICLRVTSHADVPATYDWLNEPRHVKPISFLIYGIGLGFMLYTSRDKMYGRLCFDAEVDECYLDVLQGQIHEFEIRNFVLQPLNLSPKATIIAYVFFLLMAPMHW